MLGAGAGSVLSNVRQIGETAAEGIKRSDDAFENSLEAAKNAALLSYLTGRAAPKTAIDLANVSLKTLENLITNKETNLPSSGKQVKQMVVVYEDGSVEPVSNNLLSLLAGAPSIVTN